MSLATAISTSPSPSTSYGATPSDLPTGTLRSGVRTWIPAGSLMSVNRPPSLRKSAQNEPLNDVRRPIGPADARELKALDLVDLRASR